jgi:hypothetical protein
MIPASTRVAALAAAMDEARRSRLREAAAADIAAEDAEAARLEDIHTAADALPDRTRAAGVEAAEKTLRDAIESYVSAVALYNAAVGEAWDLFTRSQPLPSGYSVQSGTGVVGIPGQTFRHIDPQDGSIAAGRSAILTRFPRTPIRLGAG